MTVLLKINSGIPEELLIREAVEEIKKGVLCAYPTETFYGLGVDVTNEQAIKRLFDVKRRDYGNYFNIIVASMNVTLSIDK